jgi:hypothetical protein
MIRLGSCFKLNSRSLAIGICSLLISQISFGKLRCSKYSFIRNFVSNQKHHRILSGVHLHSTKMEQPSPVSLILIDRDQFNTDVKLLALRVKAPLCNDYLTNWKDYLFRKPKFRTIYESDTKEYRLILLSEQYQDKSLTFIPRCLRNKHESNGGTVVDFTLRIGYEHLPTDEILRKLLPSHIQEIPTSFEQAGHIAHMNLRDEVLPYKSLIGQVILDKNPHLRTIVNKIGNIETEFRTFPLEVITDFILFSYIFIFNDIIFLGDCR